MKRRWLPRRMQPQLMLLISIILLIVIAAHSGFTLRQQVATAQKGIENQAHALVNNLAVSVAKPLVLGSLQHRQRGLGMLHTQPLVGGRTLTDAWSYAMADVGVRVQSGRSSSDISAAAATGGSFTGETLIVDGGRHLNSVPLMRR